MRSQRRTQIAILLFVLLALVVVLTFSVPIAAFLNNWAFIQVLDAVSKLGVLIAVVAFLLEIDSQVERKIAGRTPESTV